MLKSFTKSHLKKIGCPRIKWCLTNRIKFILEWKRFNRIFANSLKLTKFKLSNYFFITKLDLEMCDSQEY